MNPLYQNLYGNYRNRTFNDVWPEVSGFEQDYNDFNNGILDNGITGTAVTTLFYLLSARYGNSTVASQNEYQFKLKVFSTIFMYGPTWEKKLEIQRGIRNLFKDGKLSDDVLVGGKAVYNTALNPNQAVLDGEPGPEGEGMNTLSELTYINQQNTTNYKKSVPEAYSILTNLLEADVTSLFLDKFKKLFLTVVSPELPLWYVEDEDDDEDDTPTPSPDPTPTPTPIPAYTLYPDGIWIPIRVPTNGLVSEEGYQPTRVKFADLVPGQNYTLKLTGPAEVTRWYYKVTIGNFEYGLEPADDFTMTFDFNNDGSMTIVCEAFDYQERTVNLSITETINEPEVDEDEGTDN